MTLVAASLVPETVLLLPGAAGRAPHLTALREACDDVLARVVAARPDRVVLLAQGGPRRLLVGAATPELPLGTRATLGALGLPDDVLDRATTSPGEAVTTAGDVTGPATGGAVLQQPADVLHEPAGVVGLALLRAAGHRGPVDVQLVTTAAAARAVGEEAEHAADDVALVLVGSLSARRGPDAPLPEDPRAQAVDERAVRALAGLTPQDLTWLGDALAEAPALAVSAALPWTALVAAVEAGAVLRTVGSPVLAAPLGADLLVQAWAGGGRT